VIQRGARLLLVKGVPPGDRMVPCQAARHAPSERAAHYRAWLALCLMCFSDSTILPAYPQLQAGRCSHSDLSNPRHQALPDRRALDQHSEVRHELLDCSDGSWWLLERKNHTPASRKARQREEPARLFAQDPPGAPSRRGRPRHPTSRDHRAGSARRCGPIAGRQAPLRPRPRTNAARDS